MPQQATTDWTALSRVIADDNVPLDLKLRHVQGIITQGEEADCATVVRLLLEQHASLRHGLLEARQTQKELKQIVDKLTSPPWYPALYRRSFNTAQGARHIVQIGTNRRIVGLADGVDLTGLRLGEEVFLGSEQNVIVGRSPLGMPTHGETALFDRKLADGRLVLKWHDEDQIVDAAGTLADVPLKAGDLVRLDRSSWIAYEVIARSQGDSLFLEETPQVSFADIGGLNQQIHGVKNLISLHLFHRGVVDRYKARRKGSLLLYGPSGVGKTMLAKALANWLATLSQSRRSRFMNIKPGALHSMWYSQSEANYREVFRVARAAGESDPHVPIVLFFDEVDSVGLARGHSHQHVDDRVLNSFMAELDGLTERGNVLVIGATNRLEALDPALLRASRFGDLKLEVPRPKMPAGREILAKYLPADIPYAVNGHGDDLAATRAEILDAAISRLYAPNADNNLATIRFRDGKQRVVRFADLINGAVLANIATTAVEQACLREIETGEVGVQVADMHWAIAEEMQTMARSLSTTNCRNQLSDLPQDVDVVAVEPVARKVAHPHRYLNDERSAA